MTTVPRANDSSIKKSFTNPLNPSSCFAQLISISPLILLIFSPKKSSPRNKNPNHHFSSSPSFSLYFFSIFLLLLIFFIFLKISVLIFISTSPNYNCSAISPSSPPLSSSFSHFLSSLLIPHPPLLLASISALVSNGDLDDGSTIRLSNSEMTPLPPHGMARNLSEEEKEFWKQPDGEGYRPCLDFSTKYRRASAKISKEKKRFLVVVVSGGLNHQRNQIIDAVVIARILEAALVLPVLQVNQIWEDDSEFSDIFDVEHFKRTLRADVRIVSSLPSTHMVSKQTVHENQIPYQVPPLWIRARFFRQLNEQGFIVFKGLDSKLSRNLPPDLQKLRCKVAFHALRFTAPIMELGNKLARRMWIEGPYIAIHLRLEKDVWIKSGCRTGLVPEYDKVIHKKRQSRAEYLTEKLNMSSNQRRLAGLCPLNAFEVARLLEALGAPREARIYVSAREPFGGSQALQALKEKYPNLVKKEDLARDGELKPYINRTSSLAAIDYIVSLSSDVFLPSHGGNMDRALQGHRAYVGHRKFLKPNKRMMIRLFEEKSMADDEFDRILREVHMKAQGQPELRTKKRDGDVIAYPVPECMCKH